MAVVQTHATAESIELDELVSHLRQNFDPLSTQSYLDASELLVKLANNEHLIPDFLNSVLLKAIVNGDAFSRSTRIFVLAEEKDFIIRALIWETVPQGVSGEQVFYGVPHDHDFDFLTVNYVGPGLESEVYEYDNSKIEGKAGEDVEITPTGRIRLTKGTTAFFEAGRDIHTQIAPESLCVTINIMGPSRVRRSPFWFDVDGQKVVDWVDHTENIQAAIINSTSVLHDQRTRPILDRFRSTTQNPRLKHLSEIAMEQIS